MLAHCRHLRSFGIVIKRPCIANHKIVLFVAFQNIKIFQSQVGQCHCHRCMATAVDRASNAVVIKPASMCCCFPLLALLAAILLSLGVAVDVATAVAISHPAG